MSLSQLETDQIKNKSITGAKLADAISITTSLSTPTISVPSITFSTYSVNIGDPITIDSVTIEGIARRAKGLVIKNGTVDLFHIDDAGDVYIKGNINFGGVINSTTTTVNTMEVADYEIILNASVTTPYTSGARLSINRGGANYDPYIGWNETSKYWELYDGTNTARFIDQVYGDTKYSQLGIANTFTSDITIGSTSRATNSFVRVLSADGYNAGFEAYGTSQGTGYCYVGQGADYGGGIFYNGDGIPAFATGESADKISFYRRSNNVNNVVFSYAHGSNDVTFTGDILVSGNAVSFGNGSYISNETDATLDIRGDGDIRVYGTAATNNCFYMDVTSMGTWVNTENYARTIINFADGKIGFGPGTSSRDTWLYRDASNSLKTDGPFSGTRLISTVATGTAPLTITSTTKVTNLNADKLDDLEATAFATAAQGTLAANALPAASYTAADVLIKIKTVDGAGSGLDADLLDGLASTAFATAAQGIKADNAYTDGSVIMNTNPFGGKRLFINNINNAIFNANKRWTVTCEIHNTDGSVYSTPDVSPLFDGNYESMISIPMGKYLVVLINFNGSYPGFPYGNLYISHYFTGYSQSASVRTYSNYAPHGIGWHTYNFADFIRIGTSSLVVMTRNDVFDISQMEFTITAPAATDALISQIDYQLDRPGSNDMPIVDKYKANTLYYPLTLQVASGSPLVVNSTTKVVNLNADKLDDLESTAFATSAQGTLAANALPAASYTAADVLTKIKTVDGATSLLDADLLDGKHASEFFPNGGDQTSVDPNNAPDGVSYFNGVSNYPSWFPSDHSGMLYQKSFSSVYKTQIAISLHSQFLATRVLTNNVWSTWSKIWSDINDSTGSGLDADLLDGLEATAFATSAQGTLATNAVPNTRTVNSKALSANISITATDVGLSAVENTALTTWTGAATITTIGTIATGTWNATAIADGKIATALTGKTYNALTLVAAADGFTIAGGTTSRTLTVTGAAKSLSGTGTGIVLSGAFGLTFTMTGTTALTLPVSGTVTALGNTATGSGSIVLATSPTLVTPVLGIAAATSINKVILTAPATSATLTIANTKTLTVNNSITLSASNDTSTLNIGTGGILAEGAFVSNFDTRYYTETEMITHYECLKAGFNISGGGNITYSAGSNLLWTNRFIIISNGGGANFTTEGHFSIGCPTSGTITGVGGHANVVATTEGIPLAGWDAIYYILPIGYGNTSLAANFRITSYTADINIPYNWILIAVINGEAGNGTVKLCNGLILQAGQTWAVGNGICPVSHAVNAATYGYGDITNAGHIRKGNGITVTTGTFSIASQAGTAGTIGTINVAVDAIGVSLGATSTTACAGNDSRLANSRTPVAHGDSLHNHQEFARITYTGGTANIGYQWTHGLNSANVIFSITANSPETHYYYTIVDNNNVKIYLDDAPYETIILDVVATVSAAFTAATAGLTV